MADSPDSSEPKPTLQQDVDGDRNQTIGQVLGGMVVYVSGGQAIINTAREELAPDAKAITLGPNPYKGLMAFQETDGDRFFGREKQIADLWSKLRQLHEAESTIRLLPIYGPSGSGKSSLARAGLIPELAKRPIPGYDRARVAVLVPGTHPLEALATVLARIATNDPIPVTKTREFATELVQKTQTNEYDGLRRIADVLPDINLSPLIVLVDQFEEVYTLCKTQDERNAFVANLLHAASDRSKRVTIIITLRSDFLGETQKHSVLNALFAEQGFLVRSMNEEELRQAIAQPAEIAGHPLDAATIDLLVKDTEGREGALPLLQFALTRIWEGLAEGKEPADTLKAIGGVGGALAGEAQRIYESLDENGKAIARRLFLGLVQLGEGTKDTRRRALIDSLVSCQDEPAKVQQIINLFAAPGVRLITLSANDTTETAEVTHEALFEHWQQFQAWLDSSRSNIRFQRRLDEAARYWDEHKKPEGLLWRSPDLDLLQDFTHRSDHDMTHLQIQFFHCAQAAAKKRIHQKQFISFAFSGLMIATTIISLLSYQRIRHEQKVTETVFLGVNTTEIIETLPTLENSANRLRKSIDTLTESADPKVAIEHYNKHEQDFKVLFAYYRNILTILGRLPFEHSQSQKEQDERVEHTLATLLNKYRIPQLKRDLDDRSFGQFLEQPVTEFENQYSQGAFRTTYEILMTSSGAGADLNKDGFIGDVQEANQMPCELLVKIEEMWREATNNACGWYSYEGQYAPDHDCLEFIGNLDHDQSTLYTAIFSYSFDHAIDRIKNCGIQPQ